MKQRQQSSTSYPILFFMVDSSDHIAGKTGLTPTVTISKNGGAFASPSGAVSEIANGWYAIAGNATDRATLGELAIHATGTGADPTDDRYVIVPWNPFDAVRMGLTALPNAAADAAGGLPISDAGGLDMDTLLGRLDATVSSRLASGSYTAPDNSGIGDIYAIVHHATYGNAALLSHGDSAWVTATGFSTLNAAGIRSAIGMIDADLDTQLDAIASAITAVPGTIFSHTIDGVPFSVWAQIAGSWPAVATVSGATVTYYKRDATTGLFTVTKGAAAGERSDMTIL